MFVHKIVLQNQSKASLESFEGRHKLDDFLLVEWPPEGLGQPSEPVLGREFGDDFLQYLLEQCKRAMVTGE